jgi:glycosyltransferase involved in cell wall biosynthesis
MVTTLSDASRMDARVRDPGASAAVAPGRALLLEPQPFYTDRGTPIAVRDVLRALSELGWRVDVLTFPMGEDVQIPNVTLHRVGNPLGFRHVKVGFSPQKLLLDGLLAAQLRSRLRAVRYDVVHAVEETAIIYAGMAGRGGPPFVYDMASSLPEQLVAHPLFRWGPWPRSLAATERWLLNRAASVVCSAGLGDHVRAVAPDARFREWRFPAEIEPAPGPEVEALRRELGLDVAGRVILYIGNFASYQGTDLLLDAAPLVLRERPDAVLLCVGAAGADELKAAEARLPADVASRVRLVGRQARQRVPAFLGLADLLVSPRSFGANFPLKLFEYLAAGKAIVATDIRAHRCVLDESLALLVPATREGLAGGMLRLLRDPEQARGLADRALRYAAQELSWLSFKALVADIYATALAPR